MVYENTDQGPTDRIKKNKGSDQKKVVEVRVGVAIVKYSLTFLANSNFLE